MPGETDANKAIVAQHFAILNGGDPMEWDEIMADDYATHHPVSPGVGRDRYRNAFAGYGTVFSDFTTEIHHMAAEGDLVVVHATSTGRHTGEFLGMPATGRSVAFTSISLYRIANGKMAEAWYAEDTLGLFQQLGVVPADVSKFREFWAKD